MKLRRPSPTSLLGLIISVAVLAFLVVVLRDQSGNDECFPLIRSMRGPDPVERREAAVELGMLRLRGERATAAIPPLIEGLDDADQKVRVAAAESLLYFGPDAVSAVPVLARIMRTSRTDLQAPAIRLLGSIGSADARAVLIECLTDTDPERRLETIRELKSVGRNAVFVCPVLIEMLKNDTDAAVRQAILRLLVEIDTEPDRVLQAKLLATRDVSADLRKAGLSSLHPPTFRSPDPVPFLGVFQEALRDQNADVRAEAMRGLSDIGLSHPGAIPSLCDALRDARTRDAAVKALGQVTLEAFWRPPGERNAALALALNAAVPALTRAMECDDPQTCRVVASLLCQLISVSEIENAPVPPILRAAADSLRARLRHPDPVLRQYVLMTLLDRIPTELLTPVFSDLLEEENDPALEPASTADRSARRAAVASLIASAQARDLLIRRQSLINMLPEEIVRFLIPRICAALADENEDLRLQSLMVISHFCSNQKSGPKSASARTRRIVSALEIALTDRVSDIRELAAISLAELGPAASDSEPALHDAIANEHVSTVRARMEAALRQLGSAGSGKLEPH